MSSAELYRNCELEKKFLATLTGVIELKLSVFNSTQQKAIQKAPSEHHFSPSVNTVIKGMNEKVFKSQFILV